jgi:hypothetical protein
MKNLKKILIISLLTIFIGGLKTASADTFSMTYKGSTGGLATWTLDYGVDKYSYLPGATINPTRNAGSYNMRCANGLPYDASNRMYAALQDFKIGRPGSYLTFKNDNLPWAYFYGFSIFLKDGTRVDDVDVHSLFSTYNPGYTFDWGSDYQLHVNWSGDMTIVGNYYDSYGSYYDGYYNAYGGFPLGRSITLRDARVESGGSGIIYKETPVANLVSITDYSHKGVSGTPVFNSATLPGSVLIPQDAESGEYVAQVDVNPAWGGFPATPTYAKYGAWVSATTFKTCPDGSRIMSTETCSTKRCPDGSIIPYTQTCPSAYKTCPDGSSIPSAQTCPPTKTCLDGSVVRETATCYKTCPDGSSIPESQTCPRPLLCPGGISVPPGSECPILDLSEMFGRKNNLALNDVLEFFGVRKATAIIREAEMRLEELNGGGGSSGTGGTSSPAPSCGTNWWCNITLYKTPISVPFTIESVNTKPAVLVN